MGETKTGKVGNVSVDSLSAELDRDLVGTNQFDVNEVEDLMGVWVNQTIEQGMNISRNIVLLADFPKTVEGQKKNRLKGFSMQSLHTAAAQIATNRGDVFIIGGVEHMGRARHLLCIILVPAVFFRQ
ncbi:hypothetical protein CRE_24575 [Caenorhabditis remanei]|uniref:Thiolase N-terminal domain-containing protein n=1 Tax=Caenorhabditis remanei TaxID=31234 RepID=E3MV88_CAERE|nr:hypothetical protein CRE_24575 [Caenorhabditis remanei]